MKFLFAPDSFKGSMTAKEITMLLEIAALRVFSSIETLSLPIADGGEGTVDALVEATGGSYRTVAVTGPMGESVYAKYGLIDDDKTAVIEMAAAAGLPLISQSDRDPRKTTTYGVGELMLRAMDAGATKLLIGIGGSATNEGGMGMLSALGARFEDEKGAELDPIGSNLIKIHAVDLTGLDWRLREMEIVVICDVSNPLLGEKGATHVYGSQKGATPAICAELEQGMMHYADVLSKALGHDIASSPGAGAAGGLGAALHGVLGAAMKPGIDAMMEAAHFDELVKDCDLVVTGEGRIDGQSVRYGKVPVGIAKRCAALGIPTVAVVGSMGEGAEGFYDLGYTSIQPTVNAEMTLAYAMENSKELYLDAAERMFRMIQIGLMLKEGK